MNEICKLFFSINLKVFDRSFKELWRKVHRISKEASKFFKGILEKASKNFEPLTFLDSTIKFKNKIQKNIQRKLQRTWKKLWRNLWSSLPCSLKILAKFFKILGRIFRNTSKKMPNFYSNDSNQQFFSKDATFPRSPYNSFFLKLTSVASLAPGSNLCNSDTCDFCNGLTQTHVS
jgi:hypothetical protein